jgi:hypothetical protein
MGLGARRGVSRMRRMLDNLCIHHNFIAILLLPMGA